MVENINFKLGNFELRSCNLQLLQKEPHTTLEIIKWQKTNTCFVVAYWNKKELKFVGDRPLSEDKDKMWKLIEIGYGLIEEFEEE